MNTKLVNIFGRSSIGLDSETISDEAKGLSLPVSYASHIYLTIYKGLSSLIKLYVLATIKFKYLSMSMYTPYESRLPLNTAATNIFIMSFASKTVANTIYVY